MIERLKSLLGLSEEPTTKNPETHTELSKGHITSSFPGIAADGGKKWKDVRTKTPSDTERLPVRGTKGREQKYRDKLEGVSSDARERLDFLSNVGEAEIRHEWDMAFLGHGSFRDVYEFYPESNIPMENPEKYVLKVAAERDKWANEEEVKVYSQLKDTPVEDYLAPVIDFGSNFNWLLMERADVTDTPDPEVVDRMRRDCQSLGWDYGDWKPANCGYIREEEGHVPVLIDYGYYNEVDDKLKAH